MGLRVEFKEVEVADTWNRIGQTYFSIGHVNVTINEKPLRSARDISRPVTIDFIPTDELKQRQAERISEETVAAMYMNNRAAEMLAEGKLDEAYGWARAAIRQDRKFLGAYNTLGVIYKAHGNLAEAEKVLRRVMAAKPDNAIAMSNLAQVLTSAGRHEESKLLAERVERLQPYPPYHFFNLGMAAVNSGDYKKARSLFKKEVDRSPNTHEFHYWYAIASAQTGEMETAKRHMALAVESSSTLKERTVYATKLNQLISMQRTQIKDIVLQ
jgi:predicted Zn-dependent protease